MKRPKARKEGGKQKKTLRDITLKGTNKKKSGIPTFPSGKEGHEYEAQKLSQVPMLD